MPLLVPIDLSAPSRSAISLVAILARATGEDAVLLHVSPEPPSLHLLAELYALAEPLHRVDVPARLRTRTGEPAEWICQEAARRAVRWVVMGTRGRPGDGPQTGSVARAVMRACSRTVIACRPWPLDGSPDGNGDPFVLRPPAVATLGPVSPETARVARILAEHFEVPARRAAYPEPGVALEDWVRELDASGAAHLAEVPSPRPEALDALLRSGRHPVILVSPGAGRG